MNFFVPAHLEYWVQQNRARPRITAGELQHPAQNSRRTSNWWAT